MNGDRDEGGSPRNRTGVPATRYFGRKRSEISNLVAIEKPLEIFADNNLICTTMRSPGEEMPLALGYCFTSGIIDSIDDIAKLTYCREETENRIDLFLSPSHDEDSGKAVIPRTSLVYSTCGACGGGNIRDTCSSVPRRDVTFTVKIEEIIRFHDILEGRQDMFLATGNTHAAGIFGLSGDLLAFSEDTGRHNALDKAIGHLVIERKLGDARTVILTSRLSYEMVRKVIRLDAEILMGISATTSLAIDLARAVNLTLIGFSRKENGTIYTCPERILFNHC